MLRNGNAYICGGIAPGTSHSVALDLDLDGQPAFVLEPPACQLFYQTGDGNLVSHLSFIGDFEGPHPFFDISGEEKTLNTGQLQVERHAEGARLLYPGRVGCAQASQRIPGAGH